MGSEERRVRAQVSFFMRGRDAENHAMYAAAAPLE